MVRGLWIEIVCRLTYPISLYDTTKFNFTLNWDR